VSVCATEGERDKNSVKYNGRNRYAEKMLNLTRELRVLIFEESENNIK
jgi:hypothetical protein